MMDIKGGTMLIITLHNDGTGDTKTGNYNYEVFINTRRIAKGRVEDHDRRLGWDGLLSALGNVAHDAEKVDEEEEMMAKWAKMLGIDIGE